jgi:hypothetical protein
MGDGCREHRLARPVELAPLNRQRFNAIKESLMLTLPPYFSQAPSTHY